MFFVLFPKAPKPGRLRLQAQVQNMTDKWSVFMTMDGRMSMAGLSGGCSGGGAGGRGAGARRERSWVVAAWAGGWVSRWRGGPCNVVADTASQQGWCGRPLYHLPDGFCSGLPGPGVSGPVHEPASGGAGAGAARPEQTSTGTISAPHGTLAPRRRHQVQVPGRGHQGQCGELLSGALVGSGDPWHEAAGVCHPTFMDASCRVRPRGRPAPGGASRQLASRKSGRRRMT